MKMTGLEWRYLQRIALDHPYYDTHALPLTEKEAKAIVKENIKMTGKEFVDSVYANLGMTRPEEKKDRFAWLRNIGELFTVPPIRRIAVAVLVVVLMTVFFTATPTGRAIAESVIQYITSLFDDGSVVFNRNDNEAIMDPLNTVPDTGKREIREQENSNAVHVNTFEEFITAKGVRPMVLPFSYTELYYKCDESIDYLNLRAVYETAKGTIVTFQVWDAKDFEITTLTEFTVYDTDPSVYYTVEENGRITVMKLYEESIFGIVAEKGYALDEAIGLLPIE